VKELSAKFPTDLPAWQALEDHYQKDMQSKQISDLFRRNAQRFEGYSLEAGDLFLDYSKNLVNAKTRKLLLKLAKEAGVSDAIEAMFAGEAINNTEGRPVLHVALRAKMSDQVALDVPGVAQVWEVLEKMTGFVNAVHSGEIRRGAQRRDSWRDRPSHYGCREHRHWRVGSWTGHGEQGAQALLAAGHEFPQRIER